MIHERFDLRGKTAIVTGSGTGLGRAMALAMADAGCNIVGAARRRGPLGRDREGALAEAGADVSVTTLHDDADEEVQANSILNECWSIGRRGRRSASTLPRRPVWRRRWRSWSATWRRSTSW